MGVFIGVEDVGRAEFACCDDKSVGGLRLGELIDIGFDLLGLAAEVDRLADERAVQAGVWIIGADLEGLAADVTGHAGRVAEPKALIDFWIDPGFGPVPEPHTDKKRGIPGLAALIRDETVG